jgi:formylglycine-generating enzyme required for sulfatase activity
MTASYSVGQTIGRFRLLEELGRGGMGVVFKAREESTGAIVALKVVISEHTRDQLFMARFRREARASMKVHHPNVVRTVDAGEEPGVPWMAFELCSGGSLADRLRTAGRLPWRDAVAIGAAVARGLAAAHALGMVHRDVKPANVLLDEAGVPKLSDFGLVRGGAPVVGASVVSLTKTGDALGTPFYMAPEQIDGDKSIDGRADLYSLGAMLIELLTGAPPFVGSPIEVAKQQLNDPPPMPSTRGVKVPPALEALVARLLAKEASGRPASAESVATELESLGEHGVGKGRGAVVPGAVALAVVALAGVTTVANRLVGKPSAPAVPVAHAPAPTVSTTPAVSNTGPAPPARPAPGAWLAEMRRSGDAPAAVPAFLEPCEARGEYLHRASGIVFVYVPSGPFTMGDNEGRNRDCKEEAPEHTVNLSEYWIGKYEVTNEQFARFVKETGYVTTAETLLKPSFVTRHDALEPNHTVTGASFRAPYGPKGPKAIEFPHHPVVQVSYKDADAFCHWAARDLTPRWVIELPLETQWEKAARWSRAERHSRHFPWGDELAPPKLRVPSPGPGYGPEDVEKVLAGPLLTHEVGTLDDASPCGAHDMVGSVYEWVQDGYEPELYGSRLGMNPLDPEPVRSGESTMLRGSSFNSPRDLLYSTRRDRRNVQEFSAVDTGLRVVLHR